MPCVSAYRQLPSSQLTQLSTESSSGDERARHDEVALTSAVDIKLFLPSALPAEARATLPNDFVAKYRRLREAQAEDALVSLRRSIRRGALLVQHKQDHTTGPGVAANTRMQNAIANHNAKALLDAERYRAARAAMLAMDPTGGWQRRLKELNPEDIKPPLRAQGETEGRRELTWIWRVPRITSTELEEDDDDGADGEYYYAL